MRRAMAALAAALLTLAACGPAGDEFPVVDAPTADTSIGPDGAAGISSALAMNVEAIAAAAPHFIVEAVEDQIEGDRFTAITLSAGDEEVFRVLPTADGAHIHAIVTRSSQARGPNEDIVGVATFGDAPAMQVMFCAPEFVDGAPGFACSNAQDGRFWRVYKLPEGYDGPVEPFAAINPDAALAATLAEMRWIAPRVAAQP